MIQGTEEWFEARRGKITGSRFRDVMAKGRGNAMSETRASYMRDLAYERMTGKRVESPGNKYTDWGHEHEPTARVAYEMVTGELVEETGLVLVPGMSDVGSSPDGIVNEDGAIEIKCPYTARAHIAVLQSNAVPKQYQWQVQGHLYVTGCEWCDFISYHPHFPSDADLCVFRVPRDEKLIAELDAGIRQFREELEQLITRLEKEVVV